LKKSRFVKNSSSSSAQCLFRQSNSAIVPAHFPYNPIGAAVGTGILQGYDSPESSRHPSDDGYLQDQAQDPGEYLPTQHKRKKREYDGN
jgi:hypothetical protein